MRQRKERGAALVLVLLVTAAMAALIAEIISTVHGQANRTANLVAGQQAAVAAASGIEFAANYLKTLDQNYTYLETGYWAAPVEGVNIEIFVEDESGKLQANSIVFPNGEINEEAYSSLRALLKTIGMEPSLSEALADWLDMDDLMRPGGAESVYYGKLPAPYAAKNGKLDTVGELSLVKGFDSDMASGLGRHLTVYSDGLVNINTASREVITSLSEEITGEMADRLIERRAEKPFRNTSDIGAISGFETLVFELQGRIKVKSDIFRIRTRASSEGVVREAEAVVRTGGTKKVLYWRAR